MRYRLIGTRRADRTQRHLATVHWPYHTARDVARELAAQTGGPYCRVLVPPVRRRRNEAEKED